MPSKQLAATLILLGLSVAIIKIQGNYPFLYVCLLWLLAMLLVFFTARKERIRLVSLYLASAVVAFALAEAYFIGFFSFNEPSTVNRSEIEVKKGGRYQHHPLFGYAAVDNSQLRVKDYYGDTLLFDINFTTDQHGWRIMPPYEPANREAILFLGCSYTFGDGVNDDETMPYRFQEAQKDKIKAFNFGFNGYGPHQMLMLLEQELEKEVIKDYQPKFAVYQALPHHAYRCAGKTDYDFYGPRYALADNGELVYRGPFNNFLVANISIILSKSYLLNRLFFNKRKVEPPDVELMVQIVKKMDSIFTRRYQGKFIVIIWDLEYQQNSSVKNLYAKICKKLKALNLNVLEIKDILPEYHSRSRTYFIPHDSHPNAFAHQKVADYLSGLLIENDTVKADLSSTNFVYE